MSREMARVTRTTSGEGSVASPFTLWEGGRSGSRGAAPSPDADRGGDALAVALEAPSLFQGEIPSIADRRGPGVDGSATAVMALPPVALAEEPRRGDAGDAEVGARSNPVDWKLIGASLMLVLTMAIGALAVRWVVLDEAYGSLSWEEHRVVAGETIDSILAGRDLPDVGLGRLVDWVEERNGLPDATILPGQTLSVPR